MSMSIDYRDPYHVLSDLAEQTKQIRKLIEERDRSDIEIRRRQLIVAEEIKLATAFLLRARRSCYSVGRGDDETFFTLAGEMELIIRQKGWTHELPSITGEEVAVILAADDPTEPVSFPPPDEERQRMRIPSLRPFRVCGAIPAHPVLELESIEPDDSLCPERSLP